LPRDLAIKGAEPWNGEGIGQPVVRTLLLRSLCCRSGTGSVAKTWPNVAGDAVEIATHGDRPAIHRFHAVQIGLRPFGCGIGATLGVGRVSRRLRGPKSECAERT